MELNRINPGLCQLHMDQTILVLTLQTLQQWLRLVPTRQLLTSGEMQQVKVKTQQMDSGTLLAKAQDYSTILTLNSKI